MDASSPGNSQKGIFSFSMLVLGKSCSINEHMRPSKGQSRTLPEDVFRDSRATAFSALSESPSLMM